MIVVGDVAVAHDDRFEFYGFSEAFRSEPICINLEGAVIPRERNVRWGVYNTEDWYKSFEGFCLHSIFIGNNHVHDVEDGVQDTYATAQRQGLACVGAGPDRERAGEPVLVHGADEYVLLGFGWRVIGCRPADHRSGGVNRLEGSIVRRQVRSALKQYGDRKVVVIAHHNYEFERYPQPAFRKLAMELVDEGVYAVIGHHPHVVGPVERYKGRTIAYSLGNWAFSYGRFFGGRLKFPASSFSQLAVQLGDRGDTVHHAQFMPPSTVVYRSSESVNAENFSLKPEFEGFDHAEYLRWFKANRIKRKGLPVYLDADASVGNWVRDRWVAGRQALIDFAAKSGLKAMRRTD